MDQDALHRVSTRSRRGVPRYSLVLAVLLSSIRRLGRGSRDRVGRPVNFGTARGLSSPFADDAESSA